MQEQKTRKFNRYVVKLQDDLELRTDEVEDELRKRQLFDVDQLYRSYSDVRLVPHHEDRRLVEDLVRRAKANNPRYVAPKFFSYFVALVPDDVDPHEIERHFLRHPNVEEAFHVQNAIGAAGHPYPDPWLPYQTFHRPASENGVDSYCAWAAPGGTGEHVRFVDIEVGGWNLEHQDLNNSTEVPGRIVRIGTEDGSDGNHGSEVLGVVVGWQNNLSGVGVAHGAKDPKFSSIYRPGPPETQDTFSTIVRCVAEIAAGDVLLLEIEQPVTGVAGKYPVEVLTNVWGAIEAATMAGIVVVEAAGNSKVDLDNYTDAAMNRPFNLAGPGYKDSGAIIVGAANSVDLARTTVTQTNFGSRVDVFSWGDQVRTATTAPDFFNTTFGATSAASAIIAGVAVVIQSIRLAAGLPYWDSTTMRAQLKSPANSIPSDNPPHDRIGRQPDLSRLMQSIGVTPGDVYARDNLADVGLPHGGSLASSPDVIFTASAPADPQAAWGEGSGQEDAYVGGTIDASLNHQLYLRVRNRGSVEAKDIKAWLYWSEPGTLILPSSWNFIGEATATTVPVGDTAQILGPVPWMSINIPADGHYCFIALLGADCDPMPDPASIVTLNDYRDLIRNENNAVWRNFNVITPPPSPSPSPTPTPGAGDFRFEFFGAGAPDRPTFMSFDVEARLPKGAALGIEVAPEVSGALGGIRHDPREIAFMRLRPETLPRRIAAQGRTRLGGLRVPTGLKIPFVLHVRLAKGTTTRGRVSVVQRLKNGEEIGRITWQIEPPCPTAR